MNKISTETLFFMTLLTVVSDRAYIFPVQIEYLCNELLTEEKGEAAFFGKILLEHGADPTIKNKNDETALEIAEREGNKSQAKSRLCSYVANDFFCFSSGYQEFLDLFTNQQSPN